ncbi:uncharacterized protein BJ171DRAFT_480293 [Polychytrium aggregatum]|uniref:uncharacterized protein n=1 Tax=Polychytrium aggregatum TaxID=110093 RepID=UPI0022FDC24E|nr:uncharacterized protein BJ171DRAFT_480293 [Polychytrium aggregatum]KAI9193216.1 hypothetical protein BJ171DRAFT_480293 [Polychytrium aggregatum]
MLSVSQLIVSEPDRSPSYPALPGLHPKRTHHSPQRPCHSPYFPRRASAPAIESAGSQRTLFPYNSPPRSKYSPPPCSSPVMGPSQLIPEHPSCYSAHASGSAYLAYPGSYSAGQRRNSQVSTLSSASSHSGYGFVSPTASLFSSRPLAPALGPASSPTEHFHFHHYGTTPPDQQFYVLEPSHPSISMAAERPFLCRECGLRFLRLHDLKRHEKLHGGVKAFICPSCKKGFSRRDALKRHTEMSDNVKRFRCVPKSDSSPPPTSPTPSESPIESPTALTQSEIEATQ